MASIEYSFMALEDLQYISDYLMDNWGEFVAKEKIEKITSSIRRLEVYPLLGADLGKIIDVPTDYQYLFTEKNYVFYRVKFDNIKIIRVLNEQQDYMMQSFGVGKQSVDEN